MSAKCYSGQIFSKNIPLYYNLIQLVVQGWHSIFTAILNKGFNFSNIIDTLQIVVLLSLSSYYAITVYIFNIMVTKSHIKSFLILIVEFYVSISIGNIFNIDKFIPLNQGILSKHIIYNFSYNWSFIFLGILIFINLVIINRLIVKRDLLDITY